MCITVHVLIKGIFILVFINQEKSNKSSIQYYIYTVPLASSFITLLMVVVLPLLLRCCKRLFSSSGIRVKASSMSFCTISVESNKYQIKIYGQDSDT